MMTIIKKNNNYGSGIDIVIQLVNDPVKLHPINTPIL